VRVRSDVSARRRRHRYEKAYSTAPVTSTSRDAPGVLPFHWMTRSFVPVPPSSISASEAPSGDHSGHDRRPPASTGVISTATFAAGADASTSVSVLRSFET